MTIKKFEQISEIIIGPILAKMSPPAQEELLSLLLKVAHPRSHPWLKKKLAQAQQSGPQKLRLSFRFPREYPETAVDRIWDKIGESVTEWGQRTYEQLDTRFRKHPSQQTVASLEGFKTGLEVNGEQVCVLMALARYRQEAEPEFVCLIGTQAAINAERDRILKEFKTDALSAKATSTIVEEQLRENPEPNKRN
jgi:hypothetical protein